MGIICNGIQRSGTHMLARCVENCGFERIEGVLRPYEFDNKDKHNRTRTRIVEFYESFKDGACTIAHAVYPTYLGDNKIIFITRHPMDWVVSLARYKEQGKPVTPTKTNVEYIIEQKMRILFGYIGWLYNSDLVVRFEDLINNDHETLSNIQKVLRCKTPIDQIAAHINKESKTYTEKLSDHKQVFDERLEKKFIDNNGGKLVEMFGYHN